MSVETPSFGGTEIALEAENAAETAISVAEAVLARRFGSTIRLIEPQVLVGSGPAAVVRARVASSPFSLARTVVIKHYASALGAGESDAFAQEAASYQLFTALPATERMCPELLAHDGKSRVLVIEDLGRAPTLRDKLFGQDAKAAERALLSWARSLGRLHATTASRELDFDALLRRLGGSIKFPDTFDQACVRVPELLAKYFKISTPSSVVDRAVQAAENLRAAPYRAFSPADLSPDNNLVTSGGVRFLDFERGVVRNVFLDAALLRVPFMSCTESLALPAGMSEAMLAAWRSEISATWPGLTDDAVFNDRLLDSQLLQIWLATRDYLQAIDAKESGESDYEPVRPVALIQWWADFARHGRALGLTDLAEHAVSVEKALISTFGDGRELAMYPAFR